jgi:hypothetical protein
MTAHAVLPESQMPANLRRESLKAKQLLPLYSDSCPLVLRNWSLVVHSHAKATLEEETRIERAYVVAHFRRDPRYVCEHICECLVSRGLSWLL